MSKPIRALFSLIAAAGAICLLYWGYLPREWEAIFSWPVNGALPVLYIIILAAAGCALLTSFPAFIGAPQRLPPRIKGSVQVKQTDEIVNREQLPNYLRRYVEALTTEEWSKLIAAMRKIGEGEEKIETTSWAVNDLFRGKSREESAKLFRQMCEYMRGVLEESRPLPDSEWAGGRRIQLTKTSGDRAMSSR